jgi:hypothetical protein
MTARSTFGRSPSQGASAAEYRRCRALRKAVSRMIPSHEKPPAT